MDQAEATEEDEQQKLPISFKRLWSMTPDVQQMYESLSSLPFAAVMAIVEAPGQRREEFDQTYATRYLGAQFTTTPGDEDDRGFSAGLLLGGDQGPTDHYDVSRQEARYWVVWINVGPNVHWSSVCVDRHWRHASVPPIQHVETWQQSKAGQLARLWANSVYHALLENNYFRGAFDLTNHRVGSELDVFVPLANHVEQQQHNGTSRISCGWMQLLYYSNMTHKSTHNGAAENMRAEVLRRRCKLERAVLRNRQLEGKGSGGS